MFMLIIRTGSDVKACYLVVMTILTTGCQPQNLLKNESILAPISTYHYSR